MTLQNLYFAAIIPPDAVSAEVTAFRNDFKNNYDCKAALKNMPHITLKAPFKTDAALHNDVLKWFYGLGARKSFNVQLCNFGSFDNPKNPVIYVHPVLNDDILQLQKVILNSFEAAFPKIPVHYFEHKFSPHMTVAYRDLAYAEYQKAWQIYSLKAYNATFTVNSIYLLQHNGAKWKVIAELGFIQQNPV